MAILVAASLLVASEARGQAGRCDGELADNEVRLYQFPNYIGRCESWKLGPNIRQVVVPQFPPRHMAGKTGSIRLGKDVLLAVFDRQNMIENKAFTGLQHRSQWLDLVQTSKPNLPKRMVNQIRSFILYPRAWRYPQGAMLARYTKAHQLDPTEYWGPRWYQFYPLPMYKSDTANTYQVDKRLNDTSDILYFYMCGVGTATVYRDPNRRGRSVTFPGETGCKWVYKLKKYNMAHTISSIHVSEKRR
jgi:hypothetical protein